LLLRQDNALRRMLPRALELGLLSDVEMRSAEEKLAREDRLRELADSTVLDEAATNDLLRRHDSPPVAGTARVRDLARRQGIELASLLEAAGVPADAESLEWAAIELKYEGYLAREAAAAAKLARLDEFRLPQGLTYQSFQTISTEGREKLAAHAPATLGQASRIPGVSPSDLQSLLMEIARR
jgi:tRNA uridine 5-carboxymethylaminomethyl modification enzyme